jgi:hypothetical protein
MSLNLPSLIPSPEEFGLIKAISSYAKNSCLYQGVGDESKILMILLTARELGIPPMVALNGGIWNIMGKVELSARVMNSLIRKAGHSITIVESTNKICILLGKRKDGDSFQCSFSIEDAQLAGLLKKDTWVKFPADMLYNRCMSRLARRLFSDVIGNAYVEGEISDSQNVPSLREVEFEDVSKSTQSTQKQPMSQSIDSSATNEKIEKISPQVEKISIEQLSELQCLWDKCDHDFKANFALHISEKLGCKDLKDLPSKCFELSKNAMNVNINRIPPSPEVA